MRKREQKKEPELRFSEFNDYWKTSTVEKSCGIQNNLRLPISLPERALIQGTYPYYGPTGIVDYLNEYRLNGKFALIGEDGDHFLKYSFWPQTQLVEGKFNTNNHVHIISGTQECLAEWFFAYFQHRNILPYITRQGAARYKLNKSSLSSLPIALPSIAEQKKITDFLEAIASHLSQLRRKRDLLQTYKRGVMQKIFSQQIRFKQDDGNPFPDWQYKNLSDISSIVGGGTPDTYIEKYWGGEIQWFTPTELKTKYIAKSVRTITEIGLKESSAKLLPVGTLLFSSRATVGDISITLDECSTNQGFQSFIVNSKSTAEFLYYWIGQNKKLFLRRSSGSTFLEISKKEIQKIKILLPCLEEQKIIAKCMVTVDRKIEAVERQIECMEKFKQGLLQKMFV